MTILKFIIHEELDNLDDDPRMAFMELVNHAQRRLSDLTGQLDPSDRYDSNKIDEINYGFMNVVVAAAKKFEIEPFTTMEVLEYRNFDAGDHRQFHANLDHYVTQLMLDNRIRSRRDSVAIPPQSKERTRAQLIGLRQCIEQANISDDKRESLLKKLNDFEKELEKRRIDILTVALFTFSIVGIPGSVWASGEVVEKLTSTVMQIVAAAKHTEEKTRQLPPVMPPKALSPPRANSTASETSTRRNYDLDDDIPF